MKLLIADDEAYLRDIIQKTVTEQKIFPDHKIFFACDGKQAWKFYQQEAPEVVITDIRMPQLSGVDFVKNIRKASSNTEIIVLTGIADMNQALNMIELNVFELLKKPFTGPEVGFVIKKALEKINLKKQNELIQTKQRALETSLSLKRMAAGIAHHINNPNTYIKGNLEMLTQYFNTLLPIIKDHPHMDSDKRDVINTMTEQVFESMQSAINGTERIKKVTWSLLSFIQSSDGQRHPTSLHGLIEEALAQTGGLGNKHNIIKNFESPIRKVTVNKGEMIQVFTNLIHNAADAIEEKYSENEKGHIEICVTNLDGIKKQLVLVKDNGNGIDEKILPEIFDPFFTTKAHHNKLGLGLSLSKGIVESHQGTLLCESKRGHGSQFTVCLPYN